MRNTMTKYEKLNQARDLLYRNIFRLPEGSPALQYWWDTLLALDFELDRMSIEEAEQPYKPSKRGKHACTVN